MSTLKSNKIILALLTILAIMIPFISVLSSMILGSTVSIVRDGLITFLILFLLASVLKQKSVKLSISNLLLLSFIIYGLFHVFISILDPITSFLKFRLVFFYPLISLLVIIYFKNNKYNSNNNFQFFKRIFVIQGYIILFFSVLELLLGDRLLIILYQNDFVNIHRDLLGQTGIRLVSLLYNPINLGFFLNIFLAFILFNKSKNYIFFLVKLVTIFYTLAVILLTFSRMSYIVAAITVLIYVFYSRRYFFTIRSITVGVAILFFLSVVFQMLPENNIENIKTRFGHIEGNYVKENVRLDNWNQYITTVLSEGGLFYFWGSGLGTSNSDSKYQSDKVMRVENSYISFFGELGLLGLIFFIYFLVRTIKNIIIRSKDNLVEARILFLIMLMFIICGFANDIFHNNPFSFYFWCLYFHLEIACNSSNKKLETGVNHEKNSVLE